MIDDRGYDEALFTVGARGCVLDTPGFTGENVSYAISALRSANIKGKNIVIIGGGLTGCELAYIYGVNGKKVTLIEKTDAILSALGASASDFNLFAELLDYYKVNVIKNAEVEKFENGIATVIENVENTSNMAKRNRSMPTFGSECAPNKHEIPADHIVVSAGV